MLIIIVMQEMEVRRSWSKAVLGKSARPYLKNKLKGADSCDSSGRALA
jgi:hypothetical protein